MTTTADVFWDDGHAADDCHFEQCDYCGCCAHGMALRDGCKVDLAPEGMLCPNRACNCEGKS